MAETTTTAPAPQSVPIGGSIRPLPELLAPAGDWDCARAAVENGADAIYFGLERFNARMRAHNFTTADLPQLMEFLHRRGVKGYVTFNTLVFENELADAEEHLRAIIAAGVDAAIVQDVGICRLIRQLSPDFPIHASTQMTVTSAAGVEFARELGCNLVVLARECSIKEMEKIQAAQTSTLGSGLSTIPLEVFVHGALCVAYSGQCLTSEALGGRSANRGECAQACRMPYDLVSDGQIVPLGDRKYLLSPQDLAGLDVLPDLIHAGIASLKIEGRLKSPEYVASITRIYRNALDKVGNSHRGPETQRKESDSVALGLGGQSDRYAMEMSFSRGLYTGWMEGTNNQKLVHARFGKKRGVYLGEVAVVGDEYVRLKLAAPLKLGDGVVFDAGNPAEKEEGGNVYEIRTPKTGDQVELRFAYGRLDFSRIKAGDKLWKTSDPELERRLRQSFEGSTPRFQRPVHMEVHGLTGKPFTLIARDDEGHVVQLASTMPLEKADKRPLTTEKLSEQLGRLGGTPFKLGAFKNELSGEVMLPVSELNRLRREAVAELERLRTLPKRWTLNEEGAVVPPVFPDVTSEKQRAPETTPDEAATAADVDQLIVLVRSQAQLETALQCGVQTVYCDFEDPKKYREAVTAFRCAVGCAQPRREIFIAPPRIFKMGEEWTLKLVQSAGADGYLVRNYDHLKYFKADRCVGDFSFNVANGLSAEYFKNKFRLERVTASYDLNAQQLEALLDSSPPEWFDVTIHQHMPMFHMEHCVFCAFLSTGTDYTNCGRPCDHHVVNLRDRTGAQHPLKADAGCRNTVFHAMAQTGAEYVHRLQTLGVQHFRLEFVNETPDQVAKTITKYRQLLRGEITGTDLWRELKLMNQLGVTRGQMGVAG